MNLARGEAYGCQWAIESAERRSGMRLTTLAIMRGSSRAAGGYLGPPLLDSSPVRVVYGHDTGWPSSALVAAAPHVASVHVVTRDGRSRVPLTPNAELGVQYGALLFPEGTPVIEYTYETDDGEVVSRRTHSESALASPRWTAPGDDVARPPR